MDDDDDNDNVQDNVLFLNLLLSTRLNFDAIFSHLSQNSAHSSRSRDSGMDARARAEQVRL